MRDAIRAGRLRGGERLPSSRALARELAVSRGLVQECYNQLLAEGYLTSRAGSSTRVASAAQAAAGLPPPAATESRPGPRLIADFRSGVPDLASFPRAEWAWATRESCRRIETSDLDYGDPRGSAALRQVVAAYLRRVRAADADQEAVVICAGYAQGVGLAFRALAQRGVRRAALEDPGHGDLAASGEAQAARAAGMEVLQVPVDDLGLDVIALQASGAQVAVVTPAHQSPTGVVLAPERRQALLAWAQQYDGFVIEDDYDSEFRYDGEPVGVLQGLAPDRVFAIGTVSKTLAPAVRLGWALVPPALVEAVAAQKRVSDRGSSGLDQLAVAMLLESGRYDRHLRHMRAVYAGRRAALIRSLDAHAPGVRLTGLAAGFHAVAHLPAETDERATIAVARQRSVGLYGMSALRAPGRPAPPQLVLGFGNVPEHAIEPGIAAVADLLR